MVTSYVRSVKSFITTVQGEKFPEVFKKLLPNFYSHSPRDSTQLLVFNSEEVSEPKVHSQNDLGKKQCFSVGS